MLQAAGIPMPKQTLIAIMRDEIAQSGPIPFVRFMRRPFITPNTAIAPQAARRSGRAAILHPPLRPFLAVMSAVP